MVKTRLFILFAILLFWMPAGAQQQDGSVFERRVSINQSNQPLSYILDQISWQAGVFFSYDASILNADKTVSINIENKSLFTILNNLFKPKDFKFTERENQIIISKIFETETKVNTENDTIPIKYFFLTGKIIESKKGEPIKYASISIHKKPIGTISNFDGEFLLKIHPDNVFDTIIFSCMGYKQLIISANKILDEDIFTMTPISIRIREVDVKAAITNPHQILKNIRDNISINYSTDFKLLTAFYRETVKQDIDYINVSEAVMEVLKAPYINNNKTDVIRLIKGRKSPDVKSVNWISFKLQGGPFSITKLDVVKTTENFLNKDYEELFEYRIRKIITYKNSPVYVVEFKSVSDLVFPAYEGEIFVHTKSYAIVHAKFEMNKKSLRKAKSLMIRKKPRGIKAKPTFVQYTVNYQQFQGKWYLTTTQASVKFKIRSKHDKINATFHSVSDLLITDINPTKLKRFPRRESISRRDIFVEMINNYDPQFWGNYNIIKPNEDLRKAFKNN